MPLADPARMLRELGFAETEALVYCELLKKPEQTGYGVAKSIRKSNANVYSALARLSSKGAVEFANSERRSYQVVPPEELLSRLQKEFHAKCETTTNALAQLRVSIPQDRIYQLKNHEQIHERAAAMCARANETIAFELFPQPFERIAAALKSAVGRGVGVAGVTFSPDNVIDGATCALSVKFGREDAWPYSSAWPRDFMLVVADGREAILALFDRGTGEVLHGLYTDSIFLSLFLHASVVDGIFINIEKPRTSGKSITKRIFGRLPSGFTELLAR